MEDFRGRSLNQKEVKTPLEKTMVEYICYCDKITKGEFVEAIKSGAKTLKEVIKKLEL